MDYEKMWNMLKINARQELTYLLMSETKIQYEDIVKMATSKLILQSMERIEKIEKEK